MKKVVPAVILSFLLLVGCGETASNGIVVTAVNPDGADTHASVVIDNHSDKELAPASLVVKDEDGNDLIVQNSDPISMGEQVMIDSNEGASTNKSNTADDGLISMEISWDEQ